MKTKGILIDLDNTLYDYNSAHSFALDNTIKYMETKTGIAKEILRASYDTSRKKIHTNLNGFASSHSRLLYFQRLMESSQISYKHIVDFHNFYWDSFIGKMKLFEGVLALFDRFANKNCIVTDLTADVQFKKLIQVKLIDKVRHIVTSEEAGKEKPNPIMFYMALEKIGLEKSEVVFIGDDYEKDILGAISLGIRAIWLNRKMVKKELNENTIEVKEFKEILEVVQNDE
jgi:putative hydrolase of the HAD superfamily